MYFQNRCLSFFFSPLCCLSFDLRILITTLVSSNSTFIIFYYKMFDFANSTVSSSKFVDTHCRGLRNKCIFVSIRICMDPQLQSLHIDVCGGKISLNSQFRGLLLSMKSTKIGIARYNNEFTVYYRSTIGIYSLKNKKIIQ